MAAPGRARAAAGEHREARVREAVRVEWRRAVAARARRRVALWSVAGLAAAASIAVTVFLGNRPAASIAAPASLVVGRVASAVGGVANGVRGRHAGRGTRRCGRRRRQPSEYGRFRAGDSFMAGGGELRVDANTTVRFSGARLVALDTGGVGDFDSGLAAPGEPIAIETPAGTVRDVGTRFEVRVDHRSTRVRVRDGLVRVEQGGTKRDAGAGVELGFAGDGTVEERRIPADAPAWTWTTRAAPALVIEGATLGAFLEWMHQSGRAVAFGDDALARTAAAIVLHGDVAHLTVDEVLATVLPTCGLRHRVADGRILISRAGSGGNP